MDELSISKNEILSIFKNFEVEHNQTIACIGSIGSQVNGLMVNKSDLDYRIITSSPIERGFYYSTNYAGYSIEAYIYDWNTVKEDLLKWFNCDRKYPSIVSDLDSELVHNDKIRSLIRICLTHPLYFNEKSFDKSDKDLIQKGLFLIDGIDYEYSRAFMNYYKSLQQDKVSTRKYLYTINEIFSVIWLLKNGTVPPGFRELFEFVDVRENIKKEIFSLYEINKILPKEKNFVDKNELLNDFIDTQLLALKNDIAEFAINNATDVYKGLRFC